MSVCVPTQHTACVVCVQAWAVIVLPYPSCFQPPCCCEGAAGVVIRPSPATLSLSPPQQGLQAPNCSCMCDVVLPGKRIGIRGWEAVDLCVSRIVCGVQRGGHLVCLGGGGVACRIGMNPRATQLLDLVCACVEWGLGLEGSARLTTSCNAHVSNLPARFSSPLLQGRLVPAKEIGRHRPHRQQAAQEHPVLTTKAAASIQYRAAPPGEYFELMKSVLPCSPLALCWGLSVSADLCLGFFVFLLACDPTPYTSLTLCTLFPILLQPEHVAQDDAG